MIKATGEGRLGQDPKLAYTGGPEAKAYLKMSVASNTGFGDKKKTSWIELVMWGKRAESISKFLKRGSRIFFSGTLEINEVNKDGVKKLYPQIVSDEIIMLGSASDEAVPNTDGESRQIDAYGDIPF